MSTVPFVFNLEISLAAATTLLNPFVYINLGVGGPLLDYNNFCAGYTVCRIYKNV